ncbi:hypothetical protein V8E36_006188 [Tilletia maclaganii]
MLPSNTRGRATPQATRATRATTRSVSASAASLQSSSAPSPGNRPRPAISGALSSAIPVTRFPPHMLAALGGPIPDTPSSARGQKRTTPDDTGDPIASSSGTRAEPAGSPDVAAAAGEDAEEEMDEQTALEQARAAIESDDNDTVI